MQGHSSPTVARSLLRIIFPFPLSHVFFSFSTLISFLLIHLLCFFAWLSACCASSHFCLQHFSCIPSVTSSFSFSFSSSPVLCLFLLSVFFILLAIVFLFSPTVTVFPALSPTCHPSNHHFSSCHHSSVAVSHLAFLPFSPSIYLFIHHFSLFYCIVSVTLTASLFPHPVLLSPLIPLLPQSFHTSIICPATSLQYYFYRHTFSTALINRPRHHYPSVFVNFPDQDFCSCPFTSSRPLLFSTVCHRVVFWHFSHFHFRTVSTHQTVFILLSLCRVIFLIFPPRCRSSPVSPPSSFLLTSFTFAVLPSHFYFRVSLHFERHRSQVVTQWTQHYNKYLFMQKHFISLSNSQMHL